MEKRQSTLESFVFGKSSNFETLKNKPNFKQPPVFNKFNHVDKPSTSSSPYFRAAPVIANNFKPSQSGGFANKNDKNVHQNSNFSSAPNSKPKFVLISRERFELICVNSNQLITNICRRIESSVFDGVTKRWNFRLRMYDTLMNHFRQSRIDVEELPNLVKNIFESTMRNRKPDISSLTVPNYDLKNVDKSLLKILFPFQLEAVNFVISKNGRALIADDMGLGKTLEALAAASYYHEEWPLLIITPANVRMMWVEAIRKHFSRDFILPYNVYSPNTNKDLSSIYCFPSSSRSICVISYDLMKSQIDILLGKKFQILILDESHFIKNFKAARCKAALKLLKNARRVILLSGTPALSRPVELYPQLYCINEKLFKNFNEFVHRYCDAKQRPKQFGGGLDTSRASNLEELEILLKETVMIRRLKSEVLNQLKPKCRNKIVLDKSLLDLENQVLEDAKRNFFDESLKQSEKRQALVEFFNATSQVKIKPVVNHVLSLLHENRKFVVFAHHQSMLNSLHESILKHNFSLIRIDGQTSSENRQKLCTKFQKDSNVKVALLSITAACTGLTMTAANLVVFAEMFWNPGVLIQAEDRVHRKGQDSEVEIQYLIAKGTADDEIWRIVKEKMIVLGRGGLSKDNFDDIETVMIKDQPKMSQMVCNDKNKDNRKHTLKDFWDQILKSDIEEDVEVINYNTFTTKSGLQLDLSEIFPKMSITGATNDKADLSFDEYPDKNKSGKPTVPVLKVADLFSTSIVPNYDKPVRSSLNKPASSCLLDKPLASRFTKPVQSSLGKPVQSGFLSPKRANLTITLDSTFCSDLDDLFSSSATASPNIANSGRKLPIEMQMMKKVNSVVKIDERKSVGSLLDASLFENVEDLFGYSSPATQRIDIRKESANDPVDFDVQPATPTSPGSTSYANSDDDIFEGPTVTSQRISVSLPTVVQEKRCWNDDVEQLNPSGNSSTQRINAKLPASVDQCCSPIFKSRFGSSQLAISQRKKPLATVKPFMINDEIVCEQGEPSTSSVVPSRSCFSTKSVDNDEDDFVNPNDIVQLCPGRRPAPRRCRYGNEFVDAEAEVSRDYDDHVISSDDESDSENDCYEDSFVDFNSQPQYLNTQFQTNPPDMKSIYLQSVRTPMVGRRNKFKLAYGLNSHLNVISQVAPSRGSGDVTDENIASDGNRDDDEDDYCMDSFVVPNDYDEYKERKKLNKRKTGKAYSNNNGKNVVKRRRLLVENSSSDSD